MSEAAKALPVRKGPEPMLFAAAVFVSAGLVFLVEPMVAQLLLPRLGGSPAVWNTSLAFFQLALLLGYAYAHALQRIASVRRQVVVHVVVLLVAALALPLRAPDVFGQASTGHPIIWLLEVLTLAVGAPFAALSATAPLLQAWFARMEGEGEGARSPYVLYAASNLGSMIALLAYPFVVQPLMGLSHQTVAWSAGYGLFVVVVLGLGVLLWKGIGRAGAPTNEAAAAAPEGSTRRWRERLMWVLLAAAPSSLLLGVTTHISTDVASAPFLWVGPLVLYLLTFVVAFQAKPAISPGIALLLQGAVVAICLLLLPVRTVAWLPLLALHFAAFFLTALVCHQALVQHRPAVGRLTEFYLLMSLGGVVGGAFNAFLAPAIFNNVWEYPIVLVLAGFARPWGRGALHRPQLLLLLAGIACAAFVAYPHFTLPRAMEIALFGVTVLAAFMLRDRAPAHVALLAALAIAAPIAANRVDVSVTKRSFFGVVQLGRFDVPELGSVRFMKHGSTMHGAQADDPTLKCTPLLYYAPAGPIGQVLRAEQAAKPALHIGAVGMGAGVVAAYVRPADVMRFYEIDPLVVRLATDPARFSYIHGCAQGRVEHVLGDARLSLAKEPGQSFDVLLVDAFSSDSVPVHMLTVEAMRTYLRVIKPGGVIILHLSNRNLELTAPASAIARAAGAAALEQTYEPAPGVPLLKEAPTIVVIAAKTDADLAAFRADPRWKPADTMGVRPWTDDYTNVLGALIGRMQHPEHPRKAG